MKEKFLKERIEYKILTIAIFIVAVYFLFRIIYNVVIGFGYPREILEPANVYLTNLFIRGKSPYTLSALEWEVPGINYDYPFLTNLVVAMICKLTGCSALAGHYALSIFSILATAVIGFKMINQYSKTTVAPALGALLFMFCHWRFGYVSAAPDDFGLLVFLITVELAVNPKIKNKPLLCAIAVTISFYIKQYFVFSALGIFIYMILYSKKEALRFFLYTFVINVTVGVIVTTFWPLYWTYSFLFLYCGCFTGVNFGLSFLFEQMKYLIAIFAALFAILIAGLVMAVKKLREKNAKIRNIKVHENDAMTLCVIMIPAMLAPLMVFGRNDGAFVSYFLQLWMPQIVVVTLIIFERMLPNQAEGFKKKNLLYLGIYSFIALFTIYFGFGKLPMHTLTREEKANWEKVYSIVDEHKDNGEVVYARSLAYKALADGSTNCVCGHDGEVSDQTLELINNSRLLTVLFPYAAQIIENSKKYYSSIQAKAMEHSLSLVSHETEGYNMLFSGEYIVYFGYKPVEKIDLRVGNMVYEVSLFELR